MRYIRPLETTATEVIRMGMDERADAATLVRSALAASARADSEAAVGLLERAIERDGSAAVPRYLLAAEYARIGLIDRAIDETRRALERDPDFQDARFQLGMLHLTSGRIAEAASAWAPLEAQDAPQPLRLFAQGLLHMAQGRYAEARSLLAAGIAGNDANEALNANMRGVIEAMARTAQADAEDRGPGHVLLSAYRSSSGGTP
jgi:tetratricopeptide (TPR) repeat protein